MMQIRSVSTGELADLLQLIEAGLTQPQVIKADGQTQFSQQSQELAMGLRR